MGQSLTGVAGGGPSLPLRSLVNGNLAVRRRHDGRGAGGIGQWRARPDLSLNLSGRRGVLQRPGLRRRSVVQPPGCSGLPVACLLHGG